MTNYTTSPDLQYSSNDSLTEQDYLWPQLDATLFIVLSDHGMNSFQRGFHLNTWLHRNGFLEFQPGIAPGDGAGDFFAGVDWGRARAYALGLGAIYLNLKGREGAGIVSPAEADDVKQAIVRALTGLMFSTFSIRWSGSRWSRSNGAARRPATACLRRSASSARSSSEPTTPLSPWRRETHMRSSSLALPRRRTGAGKARTRRPPATGTSANLPTCGQRFAGRSRRARSALKFAALLERARGFDADRVATGHYARVEFDGARGRHVLKRGADRTRDQAYFLFSLTEAQLARASFPVGGMTKDAVRDYARARGLAAASKPDSQEICFVPDGDYAAFVERTAGVTAAPAGVITDAEGRVVGRHQGVHRFTIGQRKGLGLSSTVPLYVIDIDAESRRVVVGERGALARRFDRPHGIAWPYANSERKRRSGNRRDFLQALVPVEIERVLALGQPCLA